MWTLLQVKTVFLLLAAAPLVADGFDVPEETPEAPLVIHLVHDQPLTSVESLSSLRPVFENVGDSEIGVVRAIDGSEDDMRSPFYTWEVIGPDGQPLERIPRPRCGNVNPMLPEDVVLLAPGDSADLAEAWLSGPASFFDFGAPGTYRIRLVYVSDPDAPVFGLPLGPDQASPVFQRIWAGRVVSDEVELTVAAR